MIHVPRPADEPEDVRGALLQPFTRKDKKVLEKEKTEIELAREYYSSNPPPTKAFDFIRYKEFAVCKALDNLFHEKCAYCETSYRAVDALDVEHFRPKGGVSESPGHPGYWWLAAVWWNLLPSCPPCNQRRRHVTFKPGMTLEEFETALQKEPKQTSGKSNSFPLRGGNWIADENGDLDAEDPLLINPTKRNPEDHLMWVFDWDHDTYLWDADPLIPAIAPREVNGEDDPYAKASIAVYGLNRAGLVRERMERVKMLQNDCHPIIDAIDDLERVRTAEDEARLRARLVRYKRILEGYTRENQPYAGMARAFLEEFQSELARLASPSP